MGDWRSRILSHPVKLHWAGWESNTHALQRAGWQISVAEYPDSYNMNESIRIALRHEGGAHGYGMMNFDHMAYMDPLRNPWDNMDLRHMSVRMTLGRDINFQYMGTPAMDVKDFRPIDAVPAMQDIEIKRMSDFKIFRYLPQVTERNEIIVPELSMDDMLNRILEMQGPKQKELRAKIIADREGMEYQRRMANIGLIVRAA